MNNWVRTLSWSKANRASLETLLDREWLVTNGLGGYASGTIGGVASRRYHGLLIAALPGSLGRQMMFNHLTELVRLPDGSTVLLGGQEQVGRLKIHGAEHLTEFRLEMGLPVWRYEIGHTILEKHILIPHLQNTVHILYHLIRGAGPVRLKLRPSLHFRPHEGPLDDAFAHPYSLIVQDHRYEVHAEGGLPPLRLRLEGERPAFTVETEVIRHVRYRVEEGRGYPSEGSLWCPGYFRVDLEPGKPAILVGSTEPWETILSLPPATALAAERERRERLLSSAKPGPRSELAGELVFAADQFIITPTGRVEDAARAKAAGDEVRSVIAGYHWFTDWGRDTMISLEGLTLVTGRFSEAGYILRTFGHYVRDGLIPNLFPEGENQGLYHTADATLWFFHALDRYLTTTGDKLTLELLLPKMHDIVQHHLRGTRFGIGVDPADGLLRQGQEGYQLTWMDAKVGDWVVTPRRGKAVEINALWYNALRLLEGWTREVKQTGATDPAWLTPDQLADHAEKARRSFNDRFWYSTGGYLYDVVDGEQGDDPACRPNQLLAISLEHPVLEQKRWWAVVEVVRTQLVTPVGLRSLAPGHPDYKPKYDGDLRARDAAYHQGTVWAWLIGPFIDAWLRLHPADRTGGRKFLQGFAHHLSEACVGSVSEIFDAEPPYTPRGCVAQAWSVAEVLRCWALTSPGESQDAGERRGLAPP